ncbi:unnamed protein product [Schistosoma curassoni]|uniref:CUB domain-containing protein n=1 Tax=Schistosoma curassoni TaxID=6186 RepID=A0A183KN15_9TREM|nr:unnamed protein product [Schistosoma curassoni]
MVHLFPFSSSSSSSAAAAAFRMFKTFQHGLQFYLPFISNELNWRYESGIINHQISLLHNQFNFNKNFHVQISGYTAKLNIENNQFLENYCQNVLPGEKQIPENGLVQSYGMEREIILSENYFLRNKNCSYIIQLKGESQSRDLVTLQSFMKKNILQDNEICMNSEKRFQFVNPWACYTMGVFGTQNITIRHNSFENCKSISVSSNPCYELIAGIQSIQIPNFLDAQQNYWASSNITEIRQHIFDFNRWNSFSLINFNNYLTSFHVSIHFVFVQCVEFLKFLIIYLSSLIKI